MANYKIFAAGNWSTPATWGGTTNYLCPGVGQTGLTYSGTSGQLTLSLNYGVVKTPAWAVGDPVYITGSSAGTGATADGDWQVSAISGTNSDVLKLTSLYVHAWTGTVNTVRTNNGGGNTSITGAASGTGGCIKLTASAPSAGAGWAIGDTLTVSGATGCTEANGSWIVTAAPTTTTIEIAPAYSGQTGGTAYRGDIFYDAAGSYAVTLDTNVYLGKRSGSTNYFMYGGGTLTFNNNITLRLSGTILNYANTLVLSAGSGIEFVDAVTNNNRTCALTTSTAVGGPASAPSAGSRAFIRTASGGSGSWAAFSTVGTAGTPLSYVTFTGIAATGGNNVFNGSPTILNLDHCLFSGCGSVAISQGASTTATLRLTNASFKSSAGTYPLTISWQGALASGTRQISNCYFDKPLLISDGFPGGTIQDCTFNAGYAVGGTAVVGGKWGTFLRNIVRTPNGGILALGDLTDCLAIITDPADNPTWWYKPNLYDATFSGIVCESPYVALTQPGDLFYDASFNATSAVTTTIKNSINLPIAVGSSVDSYKSVGAACGNFQSGRVVENVFTSLEHNTICQCVTRTDSTQFAGTGVGPYLNENITSRTISSIANNGSGKARVTLSSSMTASGELAWVTGDKIEITGSSVPGYNGFATMTWISNTVVDLDTNYISTTGASGSAYRGSNPAGLFKSLKANLYWDARSSGRYGITTLGGAYGTISDMLDATNAGYNAYWNLATTSRSGTSNGTIYDLPTTGTFLGHDQSLNATGGPNFVDTSRWAGKWHYTNRPGDYGSVGYGSLTQGQLNGLVDDMFTQFAKMNDDTGADANYTMTGASTLTGTNGLLTYIRAGFAPTNAATNFTYPGDTNPITNAGAVAGSYPGATPWLFPHRMTPFHAFD